MANIVSQMMLLAAACILALLLVARPSEAFTLSSLLPIQRDAKALSASLLQKLETQPFSHHAKEYLNHEKPEHVANKVFPAFKESLNPIFESILEIYLKEHPNAEIPQLSVTHHMVEMRDGVKLSTILVVPAIKPGTKIPTMVSRSPYGPTSDAVALVYTIMNGFAAVIQDQRGTFLSEGEFSLWTLDGEDGFDTMQWVASHPWSNGDVYMVGISADGCGALTQMRMKEANKYLKGQMIILSNADGHETTYPGGAFREGLIGGWMVIQSLLTRGHSLEVTLPEILSNPKLGPYWYPIQAEHPGVNNYKYINWPIIFYAGWADIFLGMETDNFDKAIVESPKDVRDHHKLVIGPLGHCIFGSGERPELLREEARGLVNAVGYSAELFDHISKHGDKDYELPNTPDIKYGRGLKRINFYVQGPYKKNKKASEFQATLRGVTEKEYGHYWTSLDAWPKYRSTKFYAGPEGQLLNKPVSDSMLAKDSSIRGSFGLEQFVYDPKTPLDTHGGNNFVLIFLGKGCGSMEQHAMQNRKDVLLWTTAEPLEHPVAITGKVHAHLHVSSNQNDTDFFAMLLDVYPDGTAYNVVSGLRRMKYRKSTVMESVESPSLKKGEVYEVDIDLWRTSYVFAPGHKIRLAISSSNNPYYAKNDDSGKVGDTLGLEDRNIATNQIFFTSDKASYVELPIVDLKDLPRNEAFYAH